MAKHIDRVLLGAFIASVLAHLVLITGPGWALPDWQEAPTGRIEARLIATAPVTARAPRATTDTAPVSPPAPRRPPKPRPKPKPTPAQPAATLGPPPAAEPAVAPEPPPADGAPPLVTAGGEGPTTPDGAVGEPAIASQPVDGEGESVTGSVTASVTESVTESVTDPGADEELADNRYPGPIPLPREARIAFSLILGRIQVGEALQTWSRDEHGYRLRIVMETTGAARMFKALTISQTSAGGFYSGGLRPRRFSYEQTGRATSNTVFDWKQMKLTLERGDNLREFPLEVGAQDLLSLAYQLALVGGGARQTQIGVASGKNYNSNALEWPGEETVRTPSGEVRALHVRTAGQDTTTEIWLAPDLQNLPVRIMFTDRNGTATQLIATQVVADGQTLLGKTKQAQ